MKNNDELLDLVNQRDEVIGTIWKSEAHKDASKIHREVAIAVFNDKGEVLIQQRSLNKTTDPGIWVITAAGHVSAGEDPKNAVKRELSEELGLDAEVNYVDKIFRKRIGMKGSTEARFLYIYAATIKGKPVLKLDKNEVMAARWISPKKLEEFSKNNDWDINGLSHRLIMNIYQKLFNKQGLKSQNESLTS